MGLFDKKTCALCGASVGLLGGMLGENLADGAYMCGDCRKKCIPDKTLDFSAMTVDAAKALIAVADANKKKGAAEFHATRQFSSGMYADMPALDVDEDHGWFMNASARDGWVYELDDIYTFCLDVTTIPLSEGEVYNVNLHPYPQLPACAIGALTYVALYMLKTGIYGAIAGNIWGPVASKFPASIINAGAAMIAAPLFYRAVLPALKAGGILKQVEAAAK